MIDTTLFFVHYIILLFYGILLAFSFAGIQFMHRKNAIIIIACFTFCGLLQLLSYLQFGELAVWKIYPLIVHFPLIIVLHFYYHKQFITSLTAVSTAYLCCQPSKWLGLLCETLTHNYVLEQLTRIITLLIFSIMVIYALAPYLSQLFNKDFWSVSIFGSVPIFYYLFDYLISIYTDLWNIHSHLVAEFLPFFLCLVFMSFCVVYYKEYEQKKDAEQKEKIVHILLEQQKKEMESIKTKEHEIRLLRHDMRLFLNNLAICIEQNAPEKVHEMISSYSSHIDRTKFKRFCYDDTINYIFSDFVAKCEVKDIHYEQTIEISEIPYDKIMISSIISNILDNALNAQDELPKEKRNIKIMMKSQNGKLLISVKNAIGNPPLFVDGFPITTKDNHGYGTKSISYITKKLGGNCQFLVQNNVFITRVML